MKTTAHSILYLLSHFMSNILLAIDAGDIDYETPLTLTTTPTTENTVIKVDGGRYGTVAEVKL